ncbi:MAG: chromate transporter [Patescibacteria group bacterium]|nr:chromate transporter [Patescibacteria group bacterium]
MTQSKTEDFKSFLLFLEENLDLYLGKKAPALPDNWREFLVKASPYLTILGVILAVLGLGGLALPFSTFGGAMVGRPFLGVNYLLSAVLLIAITVLEALAIPGLFSRNKKGWHYLYYSALINALYNIVFFNLSSLLIGSLLSFYLLFQVRGYYK